MEHQPPLPERVYAKVCEAERLTNRLRSLETDAKGCPEMARLAISLLPTWHNVRRDAISLCRLATFTLPEAELHVLAEQIRALSKRRSDLWEAYVEAAYCIDIGEVPPFDSGHSVE